MVSNADGSGEFAVMTVRRPRSFDERRVVWSPDGQSLACFAGEFLPKPNPAFRLVEVKSSPSGSAHYQSPAMEATSASV
jgi:hypothetical protein